MSLRQSDADADGEERIVVKPSTELIADEYEHSVETINTISVHTFASKSSKDQNDVRQFISTLRQNGYEIKQENQHCLDNDNVYEILQNISNNIETSNAVGGLILFFSGFSEKEGQLRMYNGERIDNIPIEEVWRKFTSHTCLGLKNKPKIFVFHTRPPGTTESDSIRLYKTTYDMAYETPAEADILIIYSKTDNTYQRNFTKQFCDNINTYGRNEDVISLVTCTESTGFETRPMIISTLTRKFYFLASKTRGHHLSIDENNERLANDLREVNEKLGHVNVNPEKKKKLFSFNLSRKNSVKKETSKEAVAKDGASSEKSEAIRRDTNIRNSNIRTRKVSKARTISQSESDGPRSSLTSTDGTKPRWRYVFKN